MTLQTSQTISEKPGNRVSQNQDDVADEGACDREEGVQELQEFRSCRMSKSSNLRVAHNKLLTCFDYHTITGNDKISEDIQGLGSLAKGPSIRISDLFTDRKLS